MRNWRSWVFGTKRLGWLLVPSFIVAVPVFLFREYAETVALSTLGGIYKAIFQKELQVSWQLLTSFLFWLFPALAVFLLGAWWQRKHAPQFFIRRSLLEKSNVDAPIEVKSADMCLLSARSIITKDLSDLSRVRLILPHPDSRSAEEWSSTPGASNLAADIRTSTQEALKRRAQVSWFPYFTGASWWIGNREDGNGFFHIEVILPSQGRNERQSYRVYKWQDQKAFNEVCRVFDDMWDTAAQQVLNKQDPGATKPVGQNRGTFDEIVHNRWILHFNPIRANLMKPIVFNKDGTIGEGRNANEYTWKLDGDLLVINRADGSLQNRFKKQAGKFISTNDPSAVGLIDQVIYRADMSS